MWTEYKRALQKYAVLDWVYLMCIVVFFVTWSLNNSEGSAGAAVQHGRAHGVDCLGPRKQLCTTYGQ
jgi:hypothetical protein